MEGLASIYMEFPKGNDDLIGAPKRVKIAPGQLVNIDFKGDGGHYQSGSRCRDRGRATPQVIEA